MKMKLILTAALLAVLATATFNSPRVVVADGGPILVCPPGKRNFAPSWRLPLTLSNLAHGLVALMAVECAATCIAFACAGNWKMSAYWFGATIINTTVYYF